MRTAAFFDRDGTINIDKGYVYKVEDLEFVAGSPELIKYYNDRGNPVIVVTNQSGIARGFFNVELLNAFHQEMNDRLDKIYHAHIDAFYYCPHLPEITGECSCRKPKPGLFFKAAEEWNIDLTQSVSYGDSKRDEEASSSAGIKKFMYIKDVI